MSTVTEATSDDDPRARRLSMGLDKLKMSLARAKVYLY